MGGNLAERGLKLSLPKKRVHPYLFRSKKECIPICSASEKECTLICSVPKKSADLSVPPWKMMQANLDPTYMTSILDNNRKLEF